MRLQKMNFPDPVVTHQWQFLNDPKRCGTLTDPAWPSAMPSSRTSAMVGEYDAHHGGENGGCELGVAQQPESQAVRE